MGGPSKPGVLIPDHPKVLPLRAGQHIKVPISIQVDHLQQIELDPLLVPR